MQALLLPCILRGSTWRRDDHFSSSVRGDVASPPLPPTTLPPSDLLDEYPGWGHGQLHALPPHVLDQYSELQLAPGLHFVPLDTA